MLHEFTTSVRRWAGLPTTDTSKAPTMPLGENPAGAFEHAHIDLGSLRGISTAAADQTPCVCPEPCERDHANE